MRVDSDGGSSNHPVAAVWSCGESGWVFSRLSTGEGKRRQRLYWDPQYFSTYDGVSTACFSVELQYIDKAKFVDGDAAVEIMRSFPLWVRQASAGTGESEIAAARVPDRHNESIASTPSATDLELDQFLQDVSADCGTPIDELLFNDFDVPNFSCYESEMALYGMHQDEMVVPILDSYSSSSDDGIPLSDFSSSASDDGSSVMF
eukprot:m.128169 g.128169  ORF g.128169 m.128169 type:complete len:204 (+) comp17421_c0_seq1:859-1470(+)